MKIQEQRSRSFLLAAGFISAILFIGSLVIFIISKSISDLFVSSVWMLFLLIISFRVKNHYKRHFYLVFLGVMIYLGLILIYSYILTSFYKTDQLLFYIYGGFFIMLTILFVYYYSQEKRL